MNPSIKGLLRLISVVFVMSCCARQVIAAELPSCSAVFPDGIQNNSNSGTISFAEGASLIGSPDNVIDTRRLTDRSDGESCGITTCDTSGLPAEPLNYNTFPNNNNDIQVREDGSQTLPGGDYDDIVLREGATLYLTGDEYRIRGTLYLYEDSSLVISGSSPVRILVRNSVRIREDVTINGNGQAANVILYSRRNIDIAEDAVVTGFVYAKENLTVGEDARVNGAISARRITLREDATVNFIPTEQSRASFDDLCVSTSGGGAIDHYGITGPASALTCEAAIVSVTAYDSDGTPITPDAGTRISLAANPGVDGWSLHNGPGAFNEPNQYEFSGSESSVSFYLIRTSPATDIDIDVSDGTATDPDDGGLKDQRIDFFDVGFTFHFMPILL